MDKQTRAECCTDSGSEGGCRNNYFDGKRLTTDSFRVEQRYFLDRRRLLNRATHGWGVVYGFPISSASGRLKIGAGLALDPCGRELLQATELQVGFDDLLKPDDKNAGDERDYGRVCWLLSAHYAEKSDGSVTVEDSCHCKHTEWERTCETVRYSLRRIPYDDCCKDFDCELKCKCGKGRCCRERAKSAKPKRGGCCLCEYLTGLEAPPEHCPLSEVDDPCGRVCVDQKHGVPLACIELVRDDRGYRTIGAEVDACGPRRLVKNNDLLFDLIRGCDLTRIAEIGWKDWHRCPDPIPFEDFSYALGEESKYAHGYLTRRFWVKFSRPVRKDTVRPDCFAMTVISSEREGGWWETLRVPIVGVDTAAEPGDPEGHVRKAALVFDGAWVEDGVRGRRSVFIGYETRVEIEIRGDFIVDCNGQTVDANAIGLHPAPTGNGAPGGTYLSTFRVAAAREAYARNAASTENREGASS